MSRRGIGGKGLGKSFTKPKVAVCSGCKRSRKEIVQEKLRKTLAEVMRELEQEAVWEAEFDVDNQARLQAGVDQFMWPGKEVWEELDVSARNAIRECSEGADDSDSYDE